MRKTEKFRTVPAFAGVAVILLLSACGHKSEVARPENVPNDAIFVSGGKVGGWWQQCTPGGPGQPVHCRIWGGPNSTLVLVDEPFFPYDGGPPPNSEELKIAPEPTFPGPDRIILTSNRVLLPQSRFEELRKFVDWLNGKSDSPR